MITQCSMCSEDTSCSVRYEFSMALSRKHISPHARKVGTYWRSWEVVTTYTAFSDKLDMNRLRSPLKQKSGSVALAVQGARMDCRRDRRSLLDVRTGDLRHLGGFKILWHRTSISRDPLELSQSNQASASPCPRRCLRTSTSNGGRSCTASVLITMNGYASERPEKAMQDLKMHKISQACGPNYTRRNGMQRRSR